MSSPQRDTDIKQAALKSLAVLAAGMTGADIQRLIRELRASCRRQTASMTWRALQDPLLAGSNLPPCSITLPIAVHEIGHAIAYEELGISTVETVRIGGQRGGEARIRLPVDAVQTEQGTMKWIACLLAGRAAEVLIFGSAMVGAGGSEDSDLARAIELALKLETAFGTAEDKPFTDILADILLQHLGTDLVRVLDSSPLSGGIVDHGPKDGDGLAPRVKARGQAAENNSMQEGN